MAANRKIVAFKGKDRPFSPINQAEFAGFMNKLHLPEKAPIACAVSGGADSMALALLAGEWAKKEKREFVAVTVDHGLRKESAKEAKDTGATLKKAGIEHVILKWEGRKPTSNIQAHARKARYELMTDYCHARSIKYLLTTHHLEDNAETFLINLSRGSGVDGLAAIPEKTGFGGLTILRPLLNVPKERLKAYLREKKIKWAEDASNKDPKYKRNSLRMLLEGLEEKELITQRMISTAANMTRVKDFLQKQTEKALKQVAITQSGFTEIDTARFLELHEEIALRVLSRILQNTSNAKEKARFESLARLYGEIKLQEFKSVTLSGVIIIRRKDSVVFKLESRG